MTPAEVVADALRTAEDYGTYESDSEHIVAALKAAGYAVVELPKWSWPTKWPVAQNVSTAAEARRLAGLLLAAAELTS